MLGTALVSFLSQVTGSINIGVSALSVMFLIGLVLFQFSAKLNREKKHIYSVRKKCEINLKFLNSTDSCVIIKTGDQGGADTDIRSFFDISFKQSAGRIRYGRICEITGYYEDLQNGRG